MKIRILWERPSVRGSIALTNAGTVAGPEAKGFAFPDGPDVKELVVEITGAVTRPGPNKTLVHLRTEEQPFSFFLADVDSESPIYIPRYHAVVTGQNDARSYREIVDAIRSSDRQSVLREIENGEEASFEAAAPHTRDIPCVTWLGISRDVRLFEVGFHTNALPNEPWDFVVPKDHYVPVSLEEKGVSSLRYDYFAGRGVGVRKDLRRWLEEGSLPILNAENLDGGIRYLSKIFTTYESRPLTAETLSGTNYLVSDFSSAHAAMTDAQREEAERLRAIQDREDAAEQTALYIRVECINTTRAPRYCWMRIPQPNVGHAPDRDTLAHSYDSTTGIGSFADGSCYLAASLDGNPVPLVEMAVLLPAGGKCTYEFRIPHRPISGERMAALAKTDFETKYRECGAFWREKLARCAQISLPEPRVENMMRAGFLHLDMVCFGKEGEDAVAPVVGVYAPIGTESSPIIHYQEFMGDTDLARRSIMYFLNKQHDNGFMHNFEAYMSETGFALFNAAEHYRYTRDAAWLKGVAPKLVKGCDYLINWSGENKREELRGRGYGMIHGKIADPTDPFHGYMLNASVYAALNSCGEVLAEIGDGNAKRLLEYAAEVKGYIDESLTESFALAPAVPLADGTWSVAVSPWPESVGSTCLYLKGDLAFTHASTNGRDTMTGVGYLQYFDMLEPHSPQDDFVVDTNTDLFFSDNTAYSQPYYNVQPYAHLKRGEAKAFLKEFYFGVSSLADRETYTFWEHHHQVSPHKTHEEAWFLMRCRWMLAMDSAGELSLLSGIPRRWLADGETIRFSGVITRLGRVSLELTSHLEQGAVRIRLELEDTAAARPGRIFLRVPHPDGRKAAGVSMGRYLPDREAVELEAFTGQIELEVRF